MIHTFFIGLFLGWGAAIPIGPLNLEIIRRNLSLGMPAGIGVGCGASLGDITFMILLCAGALATLNHPILLDIFSIIGGLILAWFGYQALVMHPSQKAGSTSKQKPFWRHLLEGYAMVMVNPYTVIFWFSVSSQFTQYSHDNMTSALIMGAGVVGGVISWVFTLNTIVHKTRHKLSECVMLWLNRLGGIIIIGFAIASFIHVFQ